MNLEERKRVEDKLSQLLDALTLGEKAILYKTLHAEGIKIADCDALIRKAPAPACTPDRQQSQPHSALRVHLARGWPTTLRP
jgi:hypothetical protein